MPEPTHAATLDALVELSFTMHARLEAAAAREGMSVSQFRLLGILRDREPIISELAAHLGLTKSSMSGLIDRAVQRRLVARVPDDQDGRSIRVRLEPAGRLLIDAAAERFTDEMRDVLARLTPAERERWTTLTTRLLASESLRPRG